MQCRERDLNLSPTISSSLNTVEILVTSSRTKDAGNLKKKKSYDMRYYTVFESVRNSAKPIPISYNNEHSVEIMCQQSVKGNLSGRGTF